ncbi:unnamed protein product [Durusdinium trenchii]|uniref:Ion transport domain-containing protein n=1 Tax=Durusdinium trenchii TaxID=1381693 RepID=A0ABP0R679_9DINO
MAAAAIIAIHRRRSLEALAAASPKAKPPTKTVASTLDLPEQGQGFWRWQRKAAWAYLQSPVQLFVAVLIAGNFVANIVEKWIDPSAEQYPQTWEAIDSFFNSVFAIELVWNMYAFWFRRFWTSAWNVFDFVVVTIGILNMSKLPLPGPLSLLRMMRAFRVFRLFKRVKSLHAIIVSLGRSAPGVANAFVVLLLVMAIYSILGQEFFMLYASNGTFVNDLNQEVELLTARGLDYGYDYWGNFGLALYTMFQVFTVESWSEGIARPLFNTNDLSQQFGVALFFVSYLLCVGVALMNVVVAVLLEKMVSDEPRSVAETPNETEEKLPEHLEKVCLDIELDCIHLKQQLSVVKRYMDGIVESVRSRQPLQPS